MSDMALEIAQQVRAASVKNQPLHVLGAGSRHFLGRAAYGATLSVAPHRGIMAYEPREMVITARAGTLLAEIEAELDAGGQMLAFEPPRFSEASTLGGAIASGLSGPRRAYAGAARDFVLGCRIVNGKGELLTFGGQVMKNVAGYDVSRLMVGAYGTLGVLLDVSLKVLPKPAMSLTLRQECSAQQALREMRELAGRPLPIDASCHLDGQLHLRLSGTPQAVAAARRSLGGKEMENGGDFWTRLRHQQLPFFQDGHALWRLSVPAACGPLALDGDSVIEWGGAQRWLSTDADAVLVRGMAQQAGGHAMLFRGGDRNAAFHPLPDGLLALHQRVKRAFDPHGILNPGRIYAEF